DRGVVLRPLPSGGRLPRPQRAAGLGGMSRLDEKAGAADLVGGDGGHDGVAPVTVRAGPTRCGGLVASPALEQKEDPPQHSRPGAAAASAEGETRRTPASLAGNAGIEEYRRIKG